MTATGKVVPLQAIFSAVKRRARELGIRKILVASSTGESAKDAVRALGPDEFEIIVVTDRAEAVFPIKALEASEKLEAFARAEEGEQTWGISPESAVRRELDDMGVRWVIQGTEIFRGINLVEGGSTHEMIAQTLYLFGIGTKVAVEITLMACDAGAVAKGEDVVVVAGSGKGLDTALVVTASHSDELFGRTFYGEKTRKFFIKEIITKPRI